MSELKKLNIKNFISENKTSFNIELTYQVFGKPVGQAPIVLVNHALTGNSNVAGDAGWWNSIIGNDKLIDTENYTVIAFNFPGNGYDGFLIRNYEEFNFKRHRKYFYNWFRKIEYQ